MRLRRSLAFAFLLSFAVACGGNSDASNNASTNDPTSSEDALSIGGSAEPANFVKVRDGLYRGAHPGAKEMNYLKDLGIHRILDLEVDDLIEAQPGEIVLEEARAKLKGIDLVREPMSSFEPAVRDEFDQRMDRILELLKTATPADPIYVHCKHGQDRTGLVIGLERVSAEGWTPQRAFDEMIALGFHKFFLGLDEYYERKTGFTE